FSKKDIQARRQRLGAKWDAVLAPGEAVLVYSGAPIPKPGGLDQTYPFLPHPAYYWLTGRRREEEVVLYTKESGWMEFQKSIPAEEAIWEGAREDLLVDEKGRSLNELDAFLGTQKFSAVYRLGQQGGPVEGKAFELRTALDQTRRIKDAAEVRLIRQLADIAAHGYRKIREVLRPGITEKDLQIAYEGEIFRQGAHTTPYDSIVGSGRNSAILHALPTRKVIGAGELVLVDAGADQYDYCVDITRTFASSDNPSSQQRDLYALVLRAHTECIALSKAGVWWRDVHLHAGRVITEGLVQLGVLKGSLDTLLEKEVGSVFFPHGLGHLVGLRVRDTGQEENLQPKKYFGARLRVDIQLQEGELITVEPGCYFIASLLESPEVQKEYRDYINWPELERWKDIGGVRIEDNILIRQDGNDNLTIGVPKDSGL
ncbi:MAG TPA: aminopeptidase P family protein, partial [Candidatus Sulfotelmatobacter sp.]|nr:aminopeptidase P family protein [Candidatus Sulfotelmatobacter sp.]